MKSYTIQTAAMLMLAAALLWQSGCGGSGANVVTDTVTPTAATVIAGTVQTFTSTVAGSTTTTSKWTCSYVYTPAATSSNPNPTSVTVNNCNSGDKMQGGTGNIGTWTSTPAASSNVLTYTAPTLANFPNPIPTITFTAIADANQSKKGTAVVSLDSGIRTSIVPATATVPVGLSPAATVSFTASLLNTPPTNVMWAVMQPVAGSSTQVCNAFPPVVGSTACGVASPAAKTCSPNCGSITTSGTVATFTAPSTLPTNTSPIQTSGSTATTSATSVTVIAWSPSDTVHFAAATITLVNATTNPITFTGIHPTTIAAGGVLQDIWLDAHNVLNTTPISITLPNGQTQSINTSTSVFTPSITPAYCTPTASGVTPVKTCDASIETRIRLTSSQLAFPGQAMINVGNIPDPNNPGQSKTISYPLTILPASPTIVSAVPDSYSQGTSVQFSADGGYYGFGGSSATPGNCANSGNSGGTPLVELLFDGNLNSVCAFGPRQFTGVLQGFQIPNPGLYPLQILWNATLPSGFTPPAYTVKTTNAAVQPNFSTLSSMYFTQATNTTPQTQIIAPPSIPLPPMGAVTNLAPSSMALNSTRGYAVLTEQAANAVQIIQLVPSGGRYVPVAVGGPVAVGNQPTSVSIDDRINLGQLNSAYAGQDMAVVVNSGDSTLSLLAVSASGATPITTVNLKGLVPGVNSPPYAVGVDPITHYAVVAFGNTATLGFIVDVNPLPHAQSCFTSSSAQSPPCAIASLSLNTGSTPQVIMQPDVPLAYVTPGGSGATSVVNLLLTDNSVALAPANSTTPSQGGASCPASGSIATFSSLTSNNLNASSPGAVLVSGVKTNSPANSTFNFNGTFNVVPGTVTTYTFSVFLNNITCPSTTVYGGGGSVTFGNPYYTFSTSPTAAGGAINPITGTFAFADPTGNPSSSTGATPQLAFISALDQTVSSLFLSRGSCNGCTPVPSGAPEVGVRWVAWDPFMNIVVAYNPQDTYDEISLIDPGGPTATGARAASRIIQAIQTSLSGTGAAGSYTPAGSSTAVTVYGPMTYDPKSNLVLVANAGSNTLSYLDLDPQSTFKKVHIRDMLVTSGGVPSAQPPLASAPNAPNPLPKAVCDPSSPTNIYSSCFPRSVTVGQSATVRILGQGFLSGGTPVARLDGSSTGVTVTNATDTEVDITIAAAQLPRAHDFALDVLSGSVGSNTMDLYATGVITLSSICASAVMPEAVAIDPIANVAVFTNYGCNNVSFINLDSTNAHNYGVPYGSLLKTVSVGTNPIGVDVIPRLGYAVVANNGDDTASVISYGGSPFNATELAFPAYAAAACSSSGKTSSNVCVGISPTGVAIDQDRAIALVTNTGGNSVTAIDLTELQLTSTFGSQCTVINNSQTTGSLPCVVTQLVATSGPPTAIAIDPNRAVAVVTNIQNSGTVGSSGGLDVLALGSWPPTKSTTASIGQLTANPTGIVYDPAPNPALFYATSTQQNAIYTFNPDSGNTSQITVGINPYSIAYNYQTGTIVSVNSTSNTTSVIDAANAPTFATRQTLGISSLSQFAVAIDQFTNTAVMVDQNNDRVLLLPIPR
jgi:DNA-binding beta-propeller fold protein YncE